MLEMHAHPYLEDLRSIQAHAAFRLLSQIKSTDIQKTIQKIIDVAFRPALPPKYCTEPFGLIRPFYKNTNHYARCCDSDYKSLPACSDFHITVIQELCGMLCFTVAHVLSWTSFFLLVLKCSEILPYSCVLPLVAFNCACPSAET